MKLPDLKLLLPNPPMMQQQFEMFNCLADPVLVIDAGYVIVYANPPMADLCGLRVEKIIGCLCHRLSHQCPHPCSNAELQGQLCSHARVFADGTPLRQQHTHQLPDGTTKIFDMTSSPLRDASGRITHVIQVLRDITEQEELRVKAAAKQNELERLFTLAPFCIAAIDTNMRVRWVNPAMEKLTGFQSQSIRNRHCYDLWGQHAADRRRRGEERVCDGCKAQQAMRDGNTYRHERRIGERVIEVITLPLTTSEGTITGAVEIGFDITAHKRTEKALQESRERLRLAVRATNLGPWDWDIRTNEVFFSTEWKWQIGYEEHEISSRYEEWESRLHPEDRERVVGALQSYAEGREKEYEVEFRLRHKDGTYRWIYTRGLVLRDETDKPYRMLGCHVDITDRKKAEEELRNNENRLRILFENSPTPLCVADFSGIKRCLDTLRQNGVNDLTAYLADHQADIDKCLQYIKILDVNEATLALIGLPSKQAFFDRIASLLKKIPLHENPQGLFAMARNEKSARHELTLYSAADERLDTIIRWSVEPGYEHNYERVLFTIEDITDRKKAERAILTNAEQMRLLHEIDQAILEAESVEEIGQVTLTLLQSHIHCVSGCIILFDFDKQRSSLLACSKEVPSAFCADHGLVFHCAEYLEFLHTGQPFLVENIQEGEKLCSIGETLLAEDFRFFLSFPLLTKGGLLGVLNLLDTEPRSIPAEQIHFIRQVTPFLAVAIQNANFLASLNRQKEELRTLTQRLAEAEETERRRLAAELHDEIGQNLSALAINLEVLLQQLALSDAAAEKRMADSIDLIDQLTGQIRTMIADLRPPVMDDYGLLASLLWLADSFMSRTGIQVRVHGNEARPRLSAAMEIALFRVAQEALTNTGKHALATVVDVELRPQKSSILLIIRDNGRGFDRRDLHAQDIPEHWGLLSMRERIEAFNGQFFLDSSPGAGTTITVEVPT